MGGWRSSPSAGPPRRARRRARSGQRPSAAEHRRSGRLLAYLFWHRPEPGHDPADYRRALLEFHRALAGGPPPGFARSLVWWVDGPPWLDPGAGSAGAFEDWYLVDDWAALGALNRGAVAAPLAPAHQAIAGLAGPGTGALYALRAGDPASAAQPCATWLNKPGAPSYPDLRQAMAGALSRPGVGLWQRQLVLGPAPEFCLLSPAPVDVAVTAQRVGVRRRLR